MHYFAIHCREVRGARNIKNLIAEVIHMCHKTYEHVKNDRRNVSATSSEVCGLKM